MAKYVIKTLAKYAEDEVTANLEPYYVRHDGSLVCWSNDQKDARRFNSKTEFAEWLNANCKEPVQSADWWPWMQKVLGARLVRLVPKGAKLVHR